MNEDTLDISMMTKEQLEALAYRLVVQRTNVERNLSLVEQEIQKRGDEVREKKPPKS